MNQQILSISRYDTAIPIKIRIKQCATGTARDITGARVFMMWYKNTVSLPKKLEKEGTVISGSEGRAQFLLERRDTWNLPAEKYLMKFRVVLADGSEFHVPMRGWQELYLQEM